MSLHKHFVLFLLLSSCTHVPTPSEQYKMVEANTGLTRVEDSDSEVPLLGKEHHGYRVVMRIQAGEVWGRYAARVTMAEIGTELGGIWGFLTGGYRHLGAHPVGSPLDRLLAHVIGQPISVISVLNHEKRNAPRLDIVSDFSVIEPSDTLPHQFSVSYFGEGSIYSEDRDFARDINEDKKVRELLGCFRSQYIRVDEKAVSFFFAGSENEYSYMIRECGGYEAFLNRIMDTLAAIADLV